MHHFILILVLSSVLIFHSSCTRNKDLPSKTTVQLQPQDSNSQKLNNFPVGNFRGTGFLIEKDQLKISDKDLFSHSSSATINKLSDGSVLIKVVANMQKSSSSQPKTDERQDTFNIVWETPTSGKLINKNVDFKDDKMSFVIGKSELVIKTWVARHQVWETHTYSLLK